MRSRKKNKKYLVFLILTIFFCNFFSFIPGVVGKLEKPKIKIGDKWQYSGWTKEVDSVENATDTFVITTTDKKNITVDGKKYYVWEFRIKYDSNPLKMNHKSYYNVSDFSLIKNDWYQVDMWSYVKNPYSIWPIQSSGKKEIDITNVRYDGNNVNTKKITRVVEYLGLKNITTKVGNFTCHTVKNYKKGDEENYILTYYTEDIGWYIKKDKYENNKFVTSMELTAYETHSGSVGKVKNIEELTFEDLSDYSVYLFVLLVSLIMVSTLLVYMFRKSKKEK